jgi:hypothetical protein
VNGYHFCTARYEASQSNRKTTNTGVLLLALMGSSIMEELNKYTKLVFMVANLLILSYSNVIGLILK